LVIKNKNITMHGHMIVKGWGLN